MHRKEDSVLLHCIIIVSVCNHLLRPHCCTHMLLDEIPLILLTSTLSSSLKVKTESLHLFNLLLSGGASLSQILRVGHRDTAFPNSESSRYVQ